MAAANSGSVGRGKPEEDETIVELLTGAHLVVSKSQARRLIVQGAVKLDDTLVVNIDHIVRPGHKTLSVGERTVTFRGNEEDGDNNDQNQRVDA